MDEKFKELSNDIKEINTNLGEIKADLRYHIKRTDMLEREVQPVAKFVFTLKMAGLVLGMIVAFLTIRSAMAGIDDNLSRIQKEVPCKIKVHSAKRSKKHNKRVGGAPNSYHLYDRARDISARCISMKKLGKIAKKYTNGVIVYKSHVHIDDRPNKLYLEK